MMYVVNFDSFGDCEIRENIFILDDKMCLTISSYKDYNLRYYSIDKILDKNYKFSITNKTHTVKLYSGIIEEIINL